MLVVNKVISVFKKFAWFKRFNARVTYEVLAKYIPAADWHFMNYGYIPGAAEVESSPPPSGVKDQWHSANMYHYLACKVPLVEKKVLEVGSGRGGGAAYIVRTFSPAQYIGLDIAKNAIELARKLHPYPGLSFVQGSGESLTMEDNSIDVVINVESCHGYGDVKKFLREVARVLRPGGYLLLVDFRNSVENMELFWQELIDSGMVIVSKEDISANVVKAIESEDESKRKKIASLVPRKYQKLFCDFAGVVGSRFYLTLKNGSRPYYRFVLRKGF
ncbi:class I SAM-dependent methyltransferase [Parachryseolinea silvisoli]|uniref:class I SAM-dependent methyltransferase n=1 Tax=Parachryseolinea silvisoli TaxID=2873601 RepID=UPI002265F1AB|nr:class I SAM-dependent methyltransferase [Parachryseolinea silvisoli]MCD9015177.1 methyltransferase domain-containing protein [Parachryseolinea silvisoli]